MFLLGLLSFLQIALLPGSLLIKAFDLKRGIIQTIIFILSLSLIFNHLFVFAVTALGVNLSFAFYSLLAIEMALFIVLYAPALKASLGSIGAKAWSDFREFISHLKIPALNKEGEPLSSAIVAIVSFLFIIMAASSLWWAFKVWVTNFDTVFTQWDAVVSWNRWATEWFSGSFPNETHRYAQLIPTNFAVSYAFLRGTQLQIFAKSFMPLFNLFILLALFDLGLTYQKTGYFIGVVVTRFLVKKFLGEYIVSGYVDVALAFFSLLPIYALLKAKANPNPDQQLSYLQIGAVFSAGTGLTKQNGLFLFALYPILAYTLVAKEMPLTNTKEKILAVIKPFLLGLIVLLPWYLFNEYRIFTGTNEVNVLYLIGDRHGERTLIERFVRAVGLLEGYALLYPLVLLTLPILDNTFQWITLLILIPYSLIWAFAFSTFSRNLALAFPLLGLVSGMSISKLIQAGGWLITKLRLHRLKLYALIIISVITILMIGQKFSDSTLLAHQRESQKEALLDYVNRPLYDYFEEAGQFEAIMTNYPIRYLPGLEDKQIPIATLPIMTIIKRSKNNTPTLG